MSDYTDLPDIFKKQEASKTPTALEEKAFQVLADLKEGYPDWTAIEVEAMLEALQTAQTQKGSERTRLMQEVVFRKAHDIKGQGATFGYPLMTEVGQVLCDMLRHKTTFTNAEVKKATAYALMMRRILKERLDGTGGKIGAALLKEMKEMK